MLNFYRRDKTLNAMLNIQITPVDIATIAGPRAALSSVQENTAKAINQINKKGVQILIELLI